MTVALQRRNTALLALSQALFITVQSTLIILGGLVGQTLATDKALATLPVTLVVVATALTTIPASLLMKRIGRQKGFAFGLLFTVGGAALSSLAIWWNDFWLFAMGALLMGVNGGFAQYYRFAAADVADAQFKAKAVSLVIAGGVVAAFIGPALVRLTNDLFAPVMFLGSYLALIVVAMVSLLVLAFLRIPPVSTEEAHGLARPLPTIITQPVFLAAVIAGLAGYAVMGLVMTATPIAMVGCGFSVSDTATVIQWHVVAMFVPSLFTGTLIQRFGVLQVILCGLLLNGVCLVVALMGLELSHFTIALIALGLGWNFSFVGGSILLTEAYRPAEKAKTQAANDFIVFGSVAVASLGAGTVVHYAGWSMVQLAALPLLMLALISTLWLIILRRRSA